MSRQIRVLVVDDCESCAGTTAETLAAEHGIEATRETSAADALRTLAETDVDCLVAGYGTVDGTGFLETVQEQYGGLPFVVLTGRDDGAVAGEAGESGVVEHLPQPGRAEDGQYERLANRIERVVSEYRTRTKYEGLVENSPDAIAHVAADGTVLAANPAMVDLLDTDRGELVGAELPAVFPGDVGERRLEVGQRVIETGQPERTEDSHDGRYFHNTFVPVEPHRERGSFQIVSRDVTERTERERELERQTERLDSFASVVSHDLRNPLNVAQSSVELMTEGCESDHLDRLDRSLVRMGDIIDDVLTLARGDDTVSDPSPVNLATMAEDAWRNVEPGDVSLVVDVDRRVEADAGRLRELLSHLFANAVEHGAGGSPVAGAPGDTDDDGGVSTVTVGVTEEGFFVADDGVGVPADRRDEIFEAGFSTGRTGTGLGLNIVRDIANAHGWSVEAGESESGGARFDIVGVTER